MNLSKTTHRSTLLPELLLGVERRNLVESSVHVTRGDGVNTDAVLGPFRSKRLSEVNNTSLGRIVAALLLRPIDDSSAHRSDEDDGSSRALADHVAAGSLGADERTIEINIDQTTEHVGVVGLRGDIGAIKIC